MGFWYIYPEKPTGPSADKNFMQPEEAQHTPITNFMNNSCHSYEIVSYTASLETRIFREHNKKNQA